MSVFSKILRLAPYVGGLCLSACTSKHVTVYSLPERQEIEGIIETILTQDSVPAKRLEWDSCGEEAIDGRLAIPLSPKLLKMQVVFQVPEIHTLPTELTPPMPSDQVLFRDILDESNQLFSVTDSAYVVYQKDSMPGFVLSESFCRKVYTTDLKELPKNQSFFEASVPIFSADRTKAFMILFYQCDGLCSESTLYLLVKAHSWKIAKKRRLSIG